MIQFTDGVVGVFFGASGGAAGEQVGQRRAERHEGDGRDGVFQADQAAEDAGHIADDGRQQADHGQRHEERQPTAEQTHRWHQGEQNLPAECQKVLPDTEEKQNKWHKHQCSCTFCFCLSYWSWFLFPLAWKSNWILRLIADRSSETFPKSNLISNENQNLLLVISPWQSIKDQIERLLKM